MADILNSDSFTVEGVGEVPLAGIGHVIAFPTSQYGWTPYEGYFNLEHGIDCFIRIFMHLFLRIGVFVFLGYVAIERIYLHQTPFLDDMLHIRAYSSLIVS